MFGGRLGLQMINALMPGEADVHHLYFGALHEARDKYDLVVLGLGNSMFQPLLGDEVLDVVGRAKASIGIFGTQYRELIPRPSLDRLIERLDTWFARYEDDVLMYGRGRGNVVHLGDWLIDQFPMNAATLDEPLQIVDELRVDHALDRAIQVIQCHKNVYSTRLQPLLCALTAAEIACLCRAAVGADAGHRFGRVPQHADRHFRPQLSGKPVLYGRSRRGPPLQGARPPQRRQGRRAHRLHPAQRGGRGGLTRRVYFPVQPAYIAAGINLIAVAVMAGHSQFKNIMHRKGKQDKAAPSCSASWRVKSRCRPRWACPIRRSIRACARRSWRRAPKTCRRTISSAPSRRRPGNDAENYDEIRYEGYGPGGVAVIVEALTDNHNRTAGEVRATFTKNGGNLATTGAVSFMFNHVGVVEYEAKAASADAMLDAAIEAGAEDVTSNEDGHQIITSAETLRDVAKALETKFGEPRKAALLWKPQNTVAVDDETGEKLLKLIESLDESDDVQNVYANFEVSDALMQKMSA